MSNSTSVSPFIPYPFSLIPDCLFPFPISLIPYPLSLFPFPFSLFPFPLSLIPYPSSLFPYPISHIPYPISHIPCPLSLESLESPESLEFLIPDTSFLARLNKANWESVSQSVPNQVFELLTQLKIFSNISQNCVDFILLLLGQKIAKLT